VYDQSDAIVDFYDADGSGAGETPGLWNRYLWNPQMEDQLLAQECKPLDSAAAETWWALSDRLGSICEFERADNGVTYSYYYGAFGQKNCSLVVHAGASFIAESFVGYSLTLEEGSSFTIGALDLPREFRYLFTCQEWDAAAALYYYDARWYDSASGRFTTQDPLGFAAGDENLYRYCHNSPTNYKDPSGMQAGAGSISDEQVSYAIKQCCVTCGFFNPGLGLQILFGYVWNFCNRSQTEQAMIDKMYDIQRDANNFATRAIAELGVKNNEYYHSALRHCYMSAKISQLLGIACGGCLGDAREDYQEKYAQRPQSPDVTARTKRYNRYGSLCVLSPNIESCCKNMLDRMTQ
jgi:RHS repeat-associated protein